MHTLAACIHVQNAIIIIIIKLIIILAAIQIFTVIYTCACRRRNNNYYFSIFYNNYSNLFFYCCFTVKGITVLKLLSDKDLLIGTGAGVVTAIKGNTYKRFKLVCLILYKIKHFIYLSFFPQATQ